MTEQAGNAAAALQPSDQTMASILACVSDAIVALDRDWRCTYVNANAALILQRRPEDLLGRQIWAEFPQATQQAFFDACQHAHAGQVTVEIEQHFPSPDRWYESRIHPNPDGLSIFFHDISERRRAGALINGQKQTLEMIAIGAPLDDTLIVLLRFIEDESPGVLCSLLLLDADGVHIWKSVAPSLPESFNQAFNGMAIGERTGSCGTAAFRREQVIVEDIADDPLWQDYREVALAHGLRACWSMPIFNSAQRVLGTFAIYSRQPGKPDDHHLGIIEFATHLAAIAISRKQDEQALRSSARRYRNTLDSILEGCQLIDSDWRYLYLNDAAARHNRRPNDELLGKTMIEAWPGIEATEVFALLKRCMDERVALQKEIEFVFPDGERAWFEVRAQPVSEGLFALSIDISERRQTEMALRASMQLLEDSQAIARIGGWEIDLASQTLVWTAETYRIHETSPGEFRPDVAIGVGHYLPDSQGIITTAMKAAVERGIGYDLELEKLTVKGRRIDVRTTCRVTCVDGRPVKLTGIMQDISERKRNERALLESRQQLSVVIDNIREGLIVSDPEGRQLSMNRAGLRMHGLSEGEISGRDLADFDGLFELCSLDGNVLPIQQWPLSRILRGETVEDFELRIRRIDSDWERIFSYTGALAKYADDKIQAFVAVYDITERKEMEAFRLAMTGAEIGTWHWDLVTGELRLSELCKLMFGIPADATMSYARFIESLHPDDRGRADQAVQQALAEHGAYQIEMRSVWPDGSTHWAASKGRAFYDAAGNPLRMEGAAIDITGRKLVEAKMLKVNEQLEASNHELRAFSYSVSHDLRAPLRGIDGWSLALLEDYGDRLDGQGREYLQRVRSETQHMGRLIDSLLQLSRVTQQEMHKARVDLSAIAEAILRGLRETDPGRNVESIVQPGLAVPGDANLLRSALTNLLENAWKFSRQRSPARIEFGCQAEAGVPIYFVRDNGAGFDMAHAGKLFSAFQRMHRQSDFPGTGIGLAIVQRIVSRHGGRIWAESALELGTVFRFTLGRET